MDQISPPFRIALLGLLAVCAVWFTVLKPKAAGDTAPAHGLYLASVAY